MAHETAFLGASTVFGKYWTKRRYFDYLIDKDNFKLTFGRSFRMMVYLDNAVANGPAKVRADVEADTRATNYLINHLADIKPELTVFVTTCDMLPETADENTPALETSDDPYVQNRINLYRELNRQYGRVLNVHLTEIANPSPDFNPLLATLLNPDKSKEPLPFAPLEEKLKECRGLGYALNTDGGWRLSAEGFLLSNSIISDLLIAQENSATIKRARH